MQTLDELEKEYIERILSIEGGRVEAAAKRLESREAHSTTNLKQYGMPGIKGRRPLQ